MQQKVTVPAFSSTSLGLPLCTLSLLFSSALLFCQLYFPYLPPESAFFFFPLPLSFFPSPTALCHWLTITVSVDMCIGAALIMRGLHPILSQFAFSLNKDWARGTMGNGVDRSVGVGGCTGSFLQEPWQKLLCCFCCFPPTKKKWSITMKEYYRFACSQKPIPHLWTWIKNPNTGEISFECLTKEGGENVRERVNRRWGVW